MNINQDFLFAGNAIFTIDNGQGTHYTFKVRKPQDDMPHFVSVLSGPDNNSSYTYMGVLTPNGTVKLTAKSKFKATSQAFRVAQFAVNCIMGLRDLPEGYTIQHEGRCGRCGRRLTRPDSIARGIGDYCRTQM